MIKMVTRCNEKVMTMMRMKMMIMLIAVCVCNTSPVNTQDPPSAPSGGEFHMGRSCQTTLTEDGGSRGVQVSTELVIEAPVWLRTKHGLEVALQNKHKPQQTCSLNPDTVYMGRKDGWIEITNTDQAVAQPCTFQASHQLVVMQEEGYVQVSCKPARSEARKEMDEALRTPRLNMAEGYNNNSDDDDDEDDDATSTTTTKTHSSIHEPDGKPETSTKTPKTPVDTHQQSSTTTPRPPTSTLRASADNQFPSTRPNQDSTSAERDDMETTMNTVSAANGPQLDILTMSKTEIPIAHEPTATVGGPEIAIGQPGIAVGGKEVAVGSSDVRESESTISSSTATTDTEWSEVASPGQNTRNLSSIAKAPATTISTDNDHDHLIGQGQVPYFIGAGACVLFLLLGIVFIVCASKRRRSKPKNPDNNEIFFIANKSYQGTLDRQQYGASDDERSTDMRNGSVNNAQMMYSGAEPEFAESFDLEEKILKSQSSSSDVAEVPKCLRNH